MRTQSEPSSSLPRKCNLLHSAPVLAHSIAYAVACSVYLCSDISCSLTPLSLIPSVPYRAEQTWADNTTQSVRGNLNDNRGDSMWLSFNGPVHLFYTPSTTQPLMDLWPSESLPFPSIDNSKSSSICHETLGTTPHPRWTSQLSHRIEWTIPFDKSAAREASCHRDSRCLLLPTYNTYL